MEEGEYQKFAWRETRPGLWQREIDEVEQFYTSLARQFEASGRMFFAITGFLSINVAASDASDYQNKERLVEKALRDGWLRLRFEHPTIASEVTFDPTEQKYMKSYTVFDKERTDAEAEAWLKSTFLTVTSNGSGLDWCNSDPPAPKVPTLFLITPDDGDVDKSTIRRDIVLRSPHDILDGIGTLQLLNNLMMHSAQAYGQSTPFSMPSPGAECANLSPPLRVAASIAPSMSLEGQERMQNMATLNKLRRSIETLQLPFRKGEVFPGKHQRVVINIPVADTDAMLAACKNIGATITHAYHASIAMALRDMQQPEAKERAVRYISYCLVNERHQCQGEYSTPKHAAAVYHSVSGEVMALDLTVPSLKDANDSITANKESKQQEFLALVEKTRDYYETIRNSPENLEMVPAMWAAGTPSLPSPNVNTPLEIPVPAPNSSPSVSISSMGVVDKLIKTQHGPFKLEDPWVTGEELGTGFGVFLGTWKGSLSLSAAYNDAWHDKVEVLTFLNRCQTIVWRGLRMA